MTLKEYEEEILRRMYDEEIIGGHYRPIEVVRAKIDWLDIMRKYKVQKSFTQVIRHLYNKGYVDFSGKSGEVCSLSQFGVSYVHAKF